MSKDKDTSENRIKLQKRTGEEMELIFSSLLIITVRGNDFPEHPYEKCVEEHYKFLKSYRLYSMADTLYLAAIILDCELVCMMKPGKKVYYFYRS